MREMLNVATRFDRNTSHEALLKKYKNPEDGDDQSEARIFLFVSVFAFAVEHFQQVTKETFVPIRMRRLKLWSQPPKGRLLQIPLSSRKGQRPRRKRKQKPTNP